MTLTRTALSILIGLGGLLAMMAVMASAAATAAPAPDAADPLAATYAAHGGLERWKTQRTFTYVLDGFPLSEQVARPNRSTVDLHSRFNRIQGESFTVGWNGAEAWSTPGPDAVGLPPRFFALGSFYFIGMPFVFADEGVILTEQGTGTFRGESYRVVQVGYAKGVGHTDDDEYTLYIDPETDRLALINHSVTEIGVERVTWIFDEWQEIDGLLVPSRMTFHEGWNPDDPGDGAEFTISEADFSREAPDVAIFAPPTGNSGQLDSQDAAHAHS